MKACKEMKYHYAVFMNISPSTHQKRIVAVNDGASRSVYNHLVGYDKERYALSKTVQVCPAYRERLCFLNDALSSSAGLTNLLPYLNLKDVDSQAVSNAIMHYRNAWIRYRTVPGTGIPAFHKKGYEQSYQTNAHYKKDATCWDDGNVRFVYTRPNETVPHHIQLPKLGTVRFRCSEKIRSLLMTHRKDTRVGTITVRRDNCGDYYVILQLSSDIPFTDTLTKTGGMVGIDMNLSNFYTDSNGDVVPNMKYACSVKDDLAKAQRVLSRRAERAKAEGRSLRESSNYQKQRIKTAGLARRVSARREAFLNTVAKRLVENQDLIVSEDLKVKNLMRNHKLAYSIADVSWGRFFALLEQKAAMYGKLYIKVPPQYTTQTCSACGHVMRGDDKIQLGTSEWTCPVCGTRHVRDHNAAVNILERGLETLLKILPVSSSPG